MEKGGGSNSSNNINNKIVDDANARGREREKSNVMEESKGKSGKKSAAKRQAALEFDELKKTNVQRIEGEIRRDEFG